MENVIIATNGQENKSLEDFLLWEWEGGKGTYEGGSSNNDPTWEELPLGEKFVYMANSIYGDMISDAWRLKIIKR